MRRCQSSSDGDADTSSSDGDSDSSDSSDSDSSDSGRGAEEEEVGQTEEGDKNARKKRKKEEESALALEKIPNAEGTGTLNRATSVTGPYGSIPVGLLDRSSELLFPYGEDLTIDAQLLYQVSSDTAAREILRVTIAASAGGCPKLVDSWLSKD